MSMIHDHLYRARIPAVPAGTPRPLWSIMIPTYNCAKFLPETLTNVLLQDQGPELMQIEVVDDHSTLDDPAVIVQQIGKGRVGFFRQAENVGITHNLDTCLRRSRGRLVHVLHGDDYVRDGFYRKLQMAFEKHPEIGAAFCRQIFMDDQGHWQTISRLEQAESGILTNWLTRIAVEQRIMTPSVVVRRSVYENLGGFDSRLVYSEDWEMWIRIAAHYPVWYEVEPLAAYRMHGGSNTGRRVRTGEDTADTRKAVEISKSYLPSHLADRLSEQANRTYALSALRTATRMLHNHDLTAAVAQIREAFHCSCSWAVVRRSLPLFLRAGVLWMGQLSSGKPR
jgi:glycosyltransferase involved in cell wall biosynthesis